MITIEPGEYKIDETFFLEKLEAAAAELNIKGEVTIKFGDKEESRGLNAGYRQKDYPTDVLSFPCGETFPEGFYLGDVFICYPVAEEQAQENGIALEEELFTLMIHGLLHLADYDHEEDGGEMLDLQDKIVARYFPGN